MEIQPTQSAPQGAQNKNTQWVIIGIIVVVGVAAVLYFMGGGLSSPLSTSPSVGQEETADIEALETQSSSDDISDIEADLEATDLDTLDQELSDIEQELEGL